MATCSELPGGAGIGSRLDPLTARPADWSRVGAPPPSIGSREFKAVNVDRTLIRRVLMTGLEDNITFGKRFASYEVTADGGVDVKFEDGTTASGSVLVGADGVRSKVRHQLLPSLTIFDTEARAVLGKTFLGPELEVRAPSEVLQALCIMYEQDRPHVKLLTDVMRFSPENRPD